MKDLDWTPSDVRLNVGDRITIAGDPERIAALRAMGWKVNEAGHAEGIIVHTLTATSRKSKSSKAPPAP